MNNTIDTDVYSNIKEIYKKSSYLDHYGGSVFITFISCIVFVFLFGYFYVKNNIQFYKTNWATEKCSPLGVMFAGLINKVHGMSGFQVTEQNFTGCLNNIVSLLADDAVEPIRFATSTLFDAIHILQEALQMIRTRIMGLVNNMKNIVSDIFGKIFNFLAPIRKMLIKFRDTLAKVNAAMVSSMFSAVGMFLGIKSFIGSFISIAVIVLIALAVIITVLLMFFFTAPLAVPPLIIFTGLSAIIIYITVALGEIMELTKPNMPEKPRCFDGNTRIKMKCGEMKTIDTLQPGDELHDGSRVTSTMKLSTHGIDMFEYNDVIVSGNHNIMNSDGVWKHVKIMDGSKPLTEYYHSYIYCINTTSKTIKINGMIFSDWDDLDEMEIFNIRQLCSALIPKYFDRQHIHKYLDGGFVSSTKVELQDGHTVSLDKLKVNDILRFNGRVLGIVKIDASDIKVKRYTIDDRSYITGPNNVLCDSDIDELTTLHMYGNEISENPRYLYHVITEDGKLMVEGVQFYDYDGSLEYFIDLNNVKKI